MGRLAGHARQALLLQDDLEAISPKPGHRLRLGLLATDRLELRGLEQESDIVMLVSGLPPASRDHVDIDVEDLQAALRGEHPQILQTRLLAGLAERHRQQVGLPVRVPPELEPAVELPMMRQQDRAALARDDPGRRSEMARREAIPGEAVRPPRDQLEDPVDRRALLGMPSRIA